MPDRKQASRAIIPYGPSTARAQTSLRLLQGPEASLLVLPRMTVHWLFHKRPNCFLSHDAIDKPQVRAIGLALANRGARIFLDAYHLVSGSEEWWAQIDAAIRRATHVIVFLSPSSCDRLLNTNDTVFEQEIALAARFGKEILLVQLGDVVGTLPGLSIRLGIDVHNKHAIAMFRGEKQAMADRRFAAAGNDPDRAFEALARSLRLPKASSANSSLEADLFEMIEDIRAIRYATGLVERHQNSFPGRKKFNEIMEDGYRRWRETYPTGHATLSELVAAADVPESLQSKSEKMSLIAWVSAPATHGSLSGATRSLWDFCFSFYGLPDPSGVDAGPRLNETTAIIDFDVNERLEQAKLFDEIGWALQRREAFPENLRFASTHYLVIRLLVFVEIARVTMNRSDKGPGKMGLVYLDRFLSEGRPSGKTPPPSATP